MKINIDDIHKRNEPYQLFLDNIKNKETSRKYQNYLFQFLRSIPDEIYQKTLGKIPQDQERKILATLFV
ncbi:MAG: site-specific integrase, partial [Nitrosopumilaceae archaeon]|nr:site-specific integrase [Nitrosopumilaceae archaeon]